MRKGVVPALAIAMTMTAILSARSDEIPTLDVGPVCRGIASQSGEELEAGLRSTSDQCVQSEQQVREQLKKEWSTFSAADKRHCVTLSKIGGESSYTELLTCLEMARDVRTYRSAAASGKATTRTPSSSSASSLSSLYLSSPSSSSPSPSPSSSSPASPRTSMLQPAPPANEPSKTQADSTVKELQRAKVEAIHLRVSEELAHAEADLKQAKEEAGRATKEAEQAKMDAQKARQSKAEAERKLNVAEAARVAAEGREEACQNAAKTQPSFRERLRSWFGRKPSNP
jgi:hypothetical protein